MSNRIKTKEQRNEQARKNFIKKWENNNLYDKSVRRALCRIEGKYKLKVGR